MISGGFSLEVFKQWAPFEKNLIALLGVALSLFSKAKHKISLSCKRETIDFLISVSRGNPRVTDDTRNSVKEETNATSDCEGAGAEQRWPRGQAQAAASEDCGGDQAVGGDGAGSEQRRRRRRPRSGSGAEGEYRATKTAPVNTLDWAGARIESQSMGVADERQSRRGADDCGTGKFNPAAVVVDAVGALSNGNTAVIVSIVGRRHAWCNESKQLEEVFALRPFLRS
ncbi:hypothetical protein Syun_006827 [Stephania yunnanensis]|uniref:Uncharacterized protein n=1 Tax=Stephania yunnanensis TaxID=152371 RepID=A0AAP0KXL5_9MAGN